MNLHLCMSTGFTQYSRNMRQDFDTGCKPRRLLVKQPPIQNQNSPTIFVQQAVESGDEEVKEDPRNGQGREVRLSLDQKWNGLPLKVKTADLTQSTSLNLPISYLHRLVDPTSCFTMRVCGYFGVMFVKWRYLPGCCVSCRDRRLG